MKVTFLGTGTSQGVPVIACQCVVCTSNDSRDNRLRSSVMFELNNKVLVIDAGPDFRYQMLRTNTTQLHAVLFTHPHRDHYAGLDDIRPFNFFSHQPMHIYANELTQVAIKRDFYYAFEEKKDVGLPEMILHTIDKEPFTIGDIPFLPIQVMHREMPVLGFRIGDFTYITDANFIEETEKEKIRGSEVLVVNALRKEKHISHFTLQEAVALATELDFPQTYFTHISHQMGLHHAVNQTLPKGMQLAHDGLIVSVNKTP